MNLVKSKLFIALVAVVLIWVVFTQVRMLDAQVIDIAKAAVLQEIPNPETAKFENLEEIQQGEKTLVCGQYSIKNDAGNYVEPKGFIVEVDKRNVSRVSEDAEEMAQYCNQPGKR